MRTVVQFVFFTVFFCQIGICEILPIKVLDNKVFMLNNQMKYKESQSLLLPLLNRIELSDSYKFEVCILLSYTYKRVYDYESTTKFLDKAIEYAVKTTNKDRYQAIVLSEKAFVYFDTQEYDKANEIMQQLAKTNYRYIDFNNQAVLIMQQAYLQFLDKNYLLAESTYDAAIKCMKKGKSCNLPMIYVKKMQLYAAMGSMPKALEAYNTSGFYADSCKIIKYRIYACEELETIYKKQKNFEAAGVISIYLDSLKLIYEKEEHIAELHNQKEAFLLHDKNDELKRVKGDKFQLQLWLILSILALFGIIWALLSYRKQKQALKGEFELFRESILLHFSQQPQQKEEILLLVETDTIEKTEEKILLSERQQEVLECLREGMLNKEIAARLYISENTVKYHIKGIYQALKINDRKELIN